MRWKFLTTSLAASLAEVAPRSTRSGRPTEIGPAYFVVRMTKSLFACNTHLKRFLFVNWNALLMFFLSIFQHFYSLFNAIHDIGQNIKSLWRDRCPVSGVRRLWTRLWRDLMICGPMIDWLIDLHKFGTYGSFSVPCRRKAFWTLEHFDPKPRIRPSRCQLSPTGLSGLSAHEFGIIYWQMPSLWLHSAGDWKAISFLNLKSFPGYFLDIN